jgi:hypothetical protein
MNIQVEDKVVAIPLEEYKALLRESEKVEFVKHYVGNTDFPQVEMIMAILDLKGEE